MKLKSGYSLLVGLILANMILSSCGASQSQTSTIQPSPTKATVTSAPVTLTVAPTPTATIPATPTSWISSLLTATPTRMIPLPTLPPDCGKVNLGHAGTQTIDNSQKILVQGTAILCGRVYLDGPFLKPLPVAEALIDLDTGNLGFESADILFCPSGGTMIFYGFCNLNNSFVREFSLNGLTMEHAKEPSFEECESGKESGNDNEPEYACVITSLGNISRVKVEQYNPVDDAMSLEISFITWKK
jgi:hypothetical protein